MTSKQSTKRIAKDARSVQAVMVDQVSANE